MLGKLHRNEIRVSLGYSLLDGIFASAMLGFIQEYFTPFLLLLGGTARHVGILSAIPNFFASVVQFISPDLTEKFKSRKKIVVIFVFFQALMLIPVCLIALYSRHWPLIFIIFVILFTAFGAIATPPWASLMSDLVYEKNRGAYFGWRNRIIGFVAVGVTVLAGYIVNWMECYNEFYGFAIIFGMAFFCRFISWYFLGKMHEPCLEHKKEDYFSVFQFLARFKESNFAKFVVFVSLLNFSVYLVSPFFAMFMLKDLKFSYITYTIIMVTATLSTQLAIPRWGRQADRVGNIKVIKITAPLIGLIPLFWVINQNPFFLLLAQIFSGFVWAGFNLCALNFIYDAVTPGKRTRCVAYFNAFNGIAICLGGLTGGLLLEKLPAILGYKVISLLLISVTLRIIVAFSFAGKIKEVRQVEKIKNRELLFSMLGLETFIFARGKDN